MSRIVTCACTCACAVYLMLAQVSFAGDLLAIVFEDSSIKVDGRTVKCDLYYILIGDDGELKRGDLLQIVQLHNDRNNYYESRGRFSADDSLDQITIHWAAAEGEKFGHVEKARLKRFDRETKKFVYEIYQHDDESQVGQKQNARIVDYDQLPSWVQAAGWSCILAKMSPAERRRYYQMQAEMLKTHSEIIDIIFKY